MRVLVVDDARGTRALLVRFLEELDFEVREAGSGEEALAALRAEPSFELVLLDRNMPRCDGHPLLERIRREPGLEDVPALMVTTPGDLSRIDIGLEGGADEYLVRPFDKQDLLLKLLLLGIDPEARAA